MNYAIKPYHPNQNFAGLMLVAALHIAFIYLLIHNMGAVIRFIQDPGIRVVPREPDKTPPVIKTDPVPITKPTFTRPTVEVVKNDLPPVFINWPTKPNEGKPEVKVELPPAGPPSAGPARIVEVSNNVGIACPNSQGVQQRMRYPEAAKRNEIQGNVLARFTVSATGVIGDIRIVDSVHPFFNNTVIQAVKQFACNGQGHDVTVDAPFSFRLK